MSDDQVFAARSTNNNVPEGSTSLTVVVYINGRPNFCVNGIVMSLLKVVKDTESFMNLWKANTVFVKDLIQQSMFTAPVTSINTRVPAIDELLSIFKNIIYFKIGQISSDPNAAEIKAEISFKRGVYGEGVAETQPIPLSGVDAETRTALFTEFQDELNEQLYDILFQ
jgi:hypothetical protein